MEYEHISDRVKLLMIEKPNFIEGAKLEYCQKKSIQRMAMDMLFETYKF